MPLSDYVNRVKNLLPQAETELGSDTPITEAVQSAVLYYSHLNPQKKLVDFAGDGSTYEWDLPSDFISCLAVEYPQGYQEPRWLDSKYYTFYLTDTGWKLRLFVTPSSGETVRLYYVASHTVDATTDTVPDEHFHVVCYYAAYIVASNLAAMYGARRSPTLEADVLNYRTKADVWRALAEHFQALAKQHFGMGAKDLAPAAASFADLDLASVVVPKPIFRER